MQPWFLLINVAVAIGVGMDASKIGVRRGHLGGGFFDSSVASWVICCLFVWVIALPCYLVARGRYQTMAALGQQAHTPSAGTWAAPAPAPSIMSWGPPTSTAVAAEPVVQQPVVQQPTAAVAPPQLSPDGHWWWNGAEWVPANTASQAVSPN